MNDPASSLLPPVEKRIEVGLAPPEAFALFTERMALWWPLATHSCGGTEAVDVALEPRAGGAIIERTRGGVLHRWGTVTVWEPPRRVEMTWHPGRTDDEATRVSVRFEPSARGCTLTLVHDGWAARGADGAAVRDSYDSGWDTVLAPYRSKADLKELA